ncbi:MAG: hypothetical protein P1U47_01390 [Zhongshania sp.]|uniref:hypothetical protein n=1 Tax=Zhongshania sp. TaxID=1971902 RepID=UPI00262C839E|nr:hypothetical protein [Zhongshania sp.]MDF1691000.1 hypothetical protein [Zhongshania sp.]
MSLSSLVILAFALSFGSAQFAHAERATKGKLSSLTTMWAALHFNGSEKTADTSPWPAAKKIETKFKFDTQPAQLQFRKGNKLVFSLSPAGLSFDASF